MTAETPPAFSLKTNARATNPMMMMMLGQSAAQVIQNGITSANDTNERNKREEREAEARRRASYYGYT